MRVIDKCQSRPALRVVADFLCILTKIPRLFCSEIPVLLQCPGQWHPAPRWLYPHHTLPGSAALTWGNFICMVSLIHQWHSGQTGERICSPSRAVKDTQDLQAEEQCDEGDLRQCYYCRMEKYTTSAELTVPPCFYHVLKSFRNNIQPQGLWKPQGKWNKAGREVWALVNNFL